MKTLSLIPSLILVGMVAVLSSCNDADIASHNLSNKADRFEINRRIVFYNGITGEYILVIEGLCSLGNNDPSHRLSVTCKTGNSDDDYKKHYLGLSDNVTFFAEQIDSAKVNIFHYKVTFKPAAIIPDIDIRN